MGVVKKIIALVFLLSFVTQSFSSNLVLANYYSNKADFIKKCINKNKPQLRCNGKCQMMKQLAEEEQKEKDNLEKKGGLKISTLSTKSFYGELVFQQVLLTTNKNTRFVVADIIDRSLSVFHPPSLAV